AGADTSLPSIYMVLARVCVVRGCRFQVEDGVFAGYLEIWCLDRAALASWRDLNAEAGATEVRKKEQLEECGAVCDVVAAGESCDPFLLVFGGVPCEPPCDPLPNPQCLWSCASIQVLEARLPLPIATEVS